MKIAVDIDDVLFEFVRGFFEFAKMNGYPHVNYDEVHTYDLWNVLNVPMEEAYDLANEYHNSEFFDRAALVPGAKDGMKILNGHACYFITHRPEKWKDKTLDFLLGNFAIQGDRVYFAKGSTNSEGKSKSRICEDLGIEVLIDDRGDYGVDYANSGLKVLMPDKPWNKGYEHENLTRCDGWKGILSEIRRMECGN